MQSACGHWSQAAICDHICHLFARRGQVECYPCFLSLASALKSYHQCSLERPRIACTVPWCPCGWNPQWGPRPMSELFWVIHLFPLVGWSVTDPSAVRPILPLLWTRRAPMDQSASPWTSVWTMKPFVSRCNCPFSWFSWNTIPVTVGILLIFVILITVVTLWLRTGSQLMLVFPLVLVLIQRLQTPAQDFLPKHPLQFLKQQEAELYSCSLKSQASSFHPPQVRVFFLPSRLPFSLLGPWRNLFKAPAGLQRWPLVWQSLLASTEGPEAAEGAVLLTCVVCSPCGEISLCSSPSNNPINHVASVLVSWWRGSLLLVLPGVWEEEEAVAG